MSADREHVDVPSEASPTSGPGAGRPPLVDFEAMGRRLTRTAIVLAGLVLLAWVVTIPVRGVDVETLMNLVGLALAVLFVAEVVIVGGSAVRGMLRAGERGDRLASGDVGLLPPQVARRLSRRNDSR